ncbi:MAG TPA: NAD(P)-binding domain-containing protein, partial [Devosia sp.]|nr:NAD(P)-binding domain-containing protein [Devosia sp.]
MRIGFIGTGTISAAVVEGLQSLPEPPAIVVSPRSEAVSTGLAARFAKVTRAATNAEVAKADIVFLGMRPMHLEEALAGIEIGAGQIVASMVAGFAIEDIRRRWPKATVCRFIPLPGIARRAGPMAMYPAVPDVVALVAPLGDLFVVGDESRLHFGGLNSFMSSYFELQRALIDAGIAAGLTADEARGYVVSLLGMLAGTAQRTEAADFDRLAEEHQTKGGLNERVRAALLAKGWFDVPAAVLRETTTIGY